MSTTLMNELISELTTAKRVIITAHDRPDGDALGAVLGLARLLKQHGNTVHITGCVPIPATDTFLLRDNTILDFDPAWVDAETILVVLDCASPERAEVAAPWLKAGGRTMVIDHHYSNACFGNVNWIDNDASSTCEMIFRLADHAGWEILPDAAEALWVGIVTDTGQYTYENTSPLALRSGARLVELGANPAAIGEKLFQNRPLNKVRISGKAIESLKLHYHDQLGTVSLTHQDFLDIGCGTDAAGEVVNIPRSIQGIIISLFFYEMEEGRETKLSIRSGEPFDATVLAGRFGGGGHQRAAGCTIPHPIPQAREEAFKVIDEIWGKALNQARAEGSNE